MTDVNINTIKQQISNKINNYPYFATNKTIQNITTDMDHHPYTRWFRGVYYYDTPIVMEREAGWRPLQNQCYNVNIPYYQEPDPEHCFEIPCTTTLPCKPQYYTRYADREALNNMINESCNQQYR